MAHVGGLIQSFWPQGKGGIKIGLSDEDRRRFLTRGAAVLAGLLIFSLGLAASYQGVMASSTFRLSKIVVTGADKVSMDDVLPLTGLTDGVSLLAVDPEAVRQRLLASPWVAKAQVRRVLPDELRIHLVEHRPAAVIMTDRPWFVDLNGEVFKTVEKGEMMDLPIISLHGADLNSNQVSRAMALLKALARPDSPLALTKLSEIQFDPDRGMIVHRLDRGPRVILGQGDLGLKFNHWRRVEADLRTKSRWEQVKYLDLRLAGQSFVGLKAES